MREGLLGSIGLVAIGRNEGDRLRACLASVVGQVAAVVYVDSGSTDGSVALAQSLGAQVVALDMAQPFTAARARNAGWQALLAAHPGLKWVQFVDGDCAVQPGWLQAAAAFLESHPRHAVVCGRRRERFPQASVYNQLCDIEWDTPVGDARSCGGDALMRVEALVQAGGYRDGLIAGEEPELCVRLRQTGWLVHRLGHEMTLHDAALLRFGQWWRRTLRGGYAFAAGAALHGAPPERHWVRETRRALAWGLVLPALAMGLGGLLHPLWLLCLMAYPAQVVRLAKASKLPGSQRWAWAGFTVLGKFPEALGVLKFALQRAQGRSVRLIEYK